jgi:hypothetical protein
MDSPGDGAGAVQKKKPPKERKTLKLEFPVEEYRKRYTGRLKLPAR